MFSSFYTLLIVSGILLVIVLVFVTLHRYIRYKERVALARLGFSMEEVSQNTGSRRYGNRGVLWGGVITAMSGLALLLGLSTIGIGAWLIAGLLPLFVGLGMVLIYFMTLSPVQNADAKAAIVAGGQENGLAREGTDDEFPALPFGTDLANRPDRPEDER